jgi:enoyl-CoA hydratase
MNRPEVMNATNARLHWELTKVWGVANDDPKTKVVVVTGAGDKAFSAGGDLSWVTDMVGNAATRSATVMNEASDIVYNMMACDKPIISAINGVAVGAGLAVAMMADISIMAEEAKITDGHVKLGVAAGDHAAICWPLMCGMAKAKYYLLTADFVSGKEAERIGLVSLSVPRAQLMDKAMEVANKLATGQPAGDPPDQALAERVDEHGAPGVRELAGDGDAVLHGRPTPRKAWLRCARSERRTSRRPRSDTGCSISSRQRSTAWNSP